ncbi:mCG146179, partial [Mus musculus]
DFNYVGKPSAWKFWISSEFLSSTNFQPTIDPFGNHLPTVNDKAGRGSILHEAIQGPRGIVSGGEKVLFVLTSTRDFLMTRLMSLLHSGYVRVVVIQVRRKGQAKRPKFLCGCSRDEFDTLATL